MHSDKAGLVTEVSEFDFIVAVVPIKSRLWPIGLVICTAPSFPFPQVVCYYRAACEK